MKPHVQNDTHWAGKQVIVWKRPINGMPQGDSWVGNVMGMDESGITLFVTDTRRQVFLPMSNIDEMVEARLPYAPTDDPNDY